MYMNADTYASRQVTSATSPLSQAPISPRKASLLARACVHRCACGSAQTRVRVDRREASSKDFAVLAVTPLPLPLSCFRDVLLKMSRFIGLDRYVRKHAQPV